jgi:hypothetical protein
VSCTKWLSHPSRSTVATRTAEARLDELRDARERAAELLRDRAVRRRGVARAVLDLVGSLSELGETRGSGQRRERARAEQRVVPVEIGEARAPLRVVLGRLQILEALERRRGRRAAQALGQPRRERESRQGAVLLRGPQPPADPAARDARAAVLHQVLGLEVRARVVVAPAGVDDRELARAEERKELRESRVQREESVERQGVLRADREARPGAVVVVVPDGRHEREAVGRAAQEDDHECARHRQQRWKAGEASSNPTSGRPPAEEDPALARVGPAAEEVARRARRRRPCAREGRQVDPRARDAASGERERRPPPPEQRSLPGRRLRGVAVGRRILERRVPHAREVARQRGPASVVASVARRIETR